MSVSGSHSQKLTWSERSALGVCGILHSTSIIRKCFPANSPFGRNSWGWWSWVDPLAASVRVQHQDVELRFPFPEVKETKALHPKVPPSWSKHKCCQTQNSTWTFISRRWGNNKNKSPKTPALFASKDKVVFCHLLLVLIYSTLRDRLTSFVLLYLHKQEITILPREKQKTESKEIKQGTKWRILLKTPSHFWDPVRVFVGNSTKKKKK